MCLEQRDFSGVTGGIPNVSAPPIDVEAFPTTMRSTMRDLLFYLDTVRAGCQILQTGLNAECLQGMHPDDFQPAGTYVERVDPGDAIDIGGTPTIPIVNVKVDGTTVVLNGNNELEAPGGGGSGDGTFRETAWQDGGVGCHMVPLAGGTSGATALAEDLAYAWGFVAHRDGTVEDVLVRVTGGGVAGCYAKAGIYTSNADGFPDALVADLGIIDMTTDAILTLTPDPRPFALTKGSIYWLVIIRDENAGSPSLGCYNDPPRLGQGLADFSASGGLYCYYMTEAYPVSVMPDPAPDFDSVGPLFAAALRHPVVLFVFDSVG